MRSGEEIRQALVAFADRWRDYGGSERAEAQTFLNELFASYGRDRREAGARLEDAHTSAGIMDLHLPGVAIIEMKAPGEAGRLDRHREQALDYWRHSADVATERPAPDYVVLCAFHRFEVWEPGHYPAEPRLRFSLDELPDRYEALLFLAGADEEPLFHHTSRAVTADAATALAEVYRKLLARDAADSPVVRNFLLELVWLFFAEDHKMIEGYPTDQILHLLETQGDTWSSYLMFGGLFSALNDRDDHGRQGVLRGTRYVNGDLFARPALVHLLRDEIIALRDTSRLDWRRVDPTIFGSLLESFLGVESRSSLGIHYTHEADIMKIVRPTIVRPWRARIEAVTTVEAGVALLEELCRFRVLDPACGCGNFLYVAYRELRALEHMLKRLVGRLARDAGLPEPGALPHYPLSNLYGIDVVESAIRIARVTLWMGHRQMTDRYGAAEPPLPLVDLSRVRVDDALKVEWPEVDCIIGNPPFLGSQHMREALGANYLDWLGKEFDIGIKDYCVYWFRRAHDHLKPGQRAGLVGTNSIAQNRARSASLEYVVSHGGVITDAVASQDWPGTAAVDVSLVNWTKSPSTTPSQFFLDSAAVSGITTDLRTPETSAGGAQVLAANKHRCFQGPIPVGDGFIIGTDEAEALLAQGAPDYRLVVRPYLIGEDIADDPQQRPRRWIIDFSDRPLEEAMHYPAALEIVRKRVKPLRDGNSRKARRERWWQFGEKALGMRASLDGLPRYIAAGRIGKRLLFAWCEPWTCPSDLTYVFAFGDDYSMGILSSYAHGAWARSRSSTLEDRLRYTPTSVFATFPWPDPVTEEQRKAVAEASRKVIARRQEVCVAEDLGLTRLYNLVDEGGYVDIKELHRELDEAVAASYGWPKSVAQDGDEIVRRLLRLNREIIYGERPYDPFSSPESGPVMEQPELSPPLRR